VGGDKGIRANFGDGRPIQLLCTQTGFQELIGGVDMLPLGNHLFHCRGLSLRPLKHMRHHLLVMMNTKISADDDHIICMQIEHRT